MRTHTIVRTVISFCISRNGMGLYGPVKLDTLSCVALFMNRTKRSEKEWSTNFECEIKSPLNIHTMESLRQFSSRILSYIGYNFIY